MLIIFNGSAWLRLNLNIWKINKWKHKCLITRFKLIFCLLQHGLFINVHLVTGKASPVVASGLVNTVDSINNPMVKFNLIVPVIGQNIDAKLKCSLQLICEYHEIQTYSQMVMITIIIKVLRKTKVDFRAKNQLKL